MWDCWKSSWVGCGVFLFVALGVMVGCDDVAEQLEEAASEEESEDRFLEARIQAAELEIEQLTSLVETYYIQHSELPEELGELIEGEFSVLEEIPKDPWRNEYVYEVKGPREFVVFSKGADGEAGTEDDVRWE